MGALILPSSGLIYLDANSVIYSVEKHPLYWPLLQPLWQAAKNVSIEIVSRDLVLLEVLVGPLKSGNTALASTYEQLFQQSQTRLFPITQTILRQAAKLRATSKLKTPDALHAATALEAKCALFITNDAGFRGVPGLSVAILDDLRTP
ncbi:MAG: PIN domain-containing protein [Acidobacteriales bacterium]|nr:PIN domain-containing protein [Terriglobales bacterium]